jgi:hypothetical protein
MSAVQARFYVSGLSRFAYDTSSVQVTLQAVSRGEHNKSWAAATPAGQITMTIKNPSAASWFTDRLGQEVSITFAEAPDDELQ